MDPEQEQEEQTLIPIEQQTIDFRSLPLVVVRLPDGRSGVVLRWICENLHVAPGPQVVRIKRTEVIADDLVYVRVQTEGGMQNMPTLILHAVAYWLATIDTRRMAEDDERRREILHYQREVVDVLYTWASAPKGHSPTQALVPVEPRQPAPDASALAWMEYHRQMAAFYQWKATTDTRLDVIEGRQVEMESRLDEQRRVLAFIPEILERLGPQTLTPQHQQQTKAHVQQLGKATGKHSATIYNDLYTAFNVPRYQDIPESDWPQVEHWFQIQLERSKR